MEDLTQEVLGDKKVITAKLQTLRGEFENLSMIEKEPVQEFLSKVSRIVSHMITIVKVLVAKSVLVKC